MMRGECRLFINEQARMDLIEDAWDATGIIGMPRVAVWARIVAYGLGV